MIQYDKDIIKSELTLEQVFDVLTELGGEPTYSSFGIISRTICHNYAHEGSRKLYYYENSHLFNCFTGCGETFDIFELIIKAKKIQENKDLTLMKAIFYLVYKFNLTGNYSKEEKYEIDDWEMLKHFDSIRAESSNSFISLPEYNKDILNHFTHPIIEPWERDGISRQVMQEHDIGFYAGDSQITIPHYDINGRLIGIRGRALVQADAEMFGKYRPLYINGVLYNHPLRYNLYNLNNSKGNIKRLKKALIVEGEKGTLLYSTYFGKENDISVAICGSSVSEYQIALLMSCGAEEIIIAFDRQFQEVGDKEYNHLKDNILKINNNFKNYVNLSFIFDKDMITSYKACPLDEGKDKFYKLFKERIVLE